MQTRVDLGPEVQRVAERLREVDKRLPTRLRKELRKSAALSVRRVRREARALPSGGRPGGTTGHPHKARQLRRLVARGVRVQASTGGRRGGSLRIVTSMPTAAQAMLPRGLDAPQGWRHPVFGNREVWVRQQGASWFRAPLAAEQPSIVRRVEKVLEDAVEWIAAAGE